MSECDSTVELLTLPPLCIAAAALISFIMISALQVCKLAIMNLIANEKPTTVLRSVLQLPVQPGLFGRLV